MAESTAESAAFKIDHFRAYDIDGVTVDFTVALKGQFDKDFRKHRLVALEHFANPVNKNEEGMINDQAHQTWYGFHPEDVGEPRRAVRLSNQFGEQKIEIGDAGVLITPAEKFEPGSSFPKRQDHYKCYRVEEGDPINRTVTLRDQFLRNRVRVLEPLLFGVPVAKHYKELEPIVNEVAHLTIYRLEPRDNHKRRGVRDQFDEYKLEILETALLAVPTLKRKWAVIP